MHTRERTVVRVIGMSALGHKRTLIQTRSPGDNPGFEITRSGSALSGLAECLGNARLERLYGRERDLLSQRCKFPGLLGQCLELLA